MDSDFPNNTLRSKNAEPYVRGEDVDKVAAALKSEDEWLKTYAPPAAEPDVEAALPNSGNAITLQEDPIVQAETGALSRRRSVRVQPQLNESVVKRAMALVPSDVIPKEGDTKESLAERIHRARFFDRLMALVAGGSRGNRRVNLNATSNSTPRRLSWSVVKRGVKKEADGRFYRTMYSYGKPKSRIRSHVHAKPMPWPIFDLGVQCFLAVRHFLSDPCISSPPTHCQLLGYYALFDSKVGMHKDDHTITRMRQMLIEKVDAESDEAEQAAVGRAVMETKGAMIAGSDVLVYSSGPLPVLFSWCSPPKGCPFLGREHYETHPHMQIDLPHGSVFVFKAVDDLHFYHEICIDWDKAPKSTDHRFAFVFRWLGEAQERDFEFLFGAEDDEDTDEELERCGVVRRVRAAKRAAHDQVCVFCPLHARN